MLFQSPKAISKNIINDNIYICPSQTLFLNQNYNSYYNYNNYSTNKFLIETPQQINMLNSLNKDYYNTENSINKDIKNKDISSSIKAELKYSSINISNVINTPQFEKICYKIFFPRDDPFHLSSTKKSPIKKNDIINNFKTSLFVENDNKKNNITNNNNNNSNYNQSTKRKNNFDTESSLIKNNNKNKNKNSRNTNNSYSFSSSNSSDDNKKNKNKNNKITKNKKCLNINNNLNKIHHGVSQNNKNGKYLRSISKLPIKKTKKFTAEIRALFKNEKYDFFEQITSASASSTKTRTTATKNKNETQMKMKMKNKIKNKRSRKNICSKRAKKYNILSEEVKRKLLLDTKCMKTIDVARKYGISTRNINRWKKIGIKRKKGSGRKFKDPLLEKKLLIWYNTQDKNNITSRQFKSKALELSNNNSFRASSGWLTTIKKKYRIKFRHN